MCQNSGVCVAHKNGTCSCECPTCQIGSLCERIDPCCNISCENGGKQQIIKDICRCSCRDGFIGMDCSWPANPCDPQWHDYGGACANGATCIHMLDSYVVLKTNKVYRGGFSCVCNKGYTGDLCESALI